MLTHKQHMHILHIQCTVENYKMPLYPLYRDIEQHSLQLTIPSSLCEDRKLKSACSSIALILIIHLATRKTGHSNLFLHE